MQNMCLKGELRSASLTQNARSLRLYYGVTRHFPLLVSGAFVLYYRNIWITCTRGVGETIVHSGGLGQGNVLIIEVDCVYKLREVSYLAIIMRFDRQIYLSRELLRRTQNGCSGESFMTLLMVSVQWRTFSIALGSMARRPFDFVVTRA